MPTNSDMLLMDLHERWRLDEQIRLLDAEPGRLAFHRTGQAQLTRDHLERNTWAVMGERAGAIFVADMLPREVEP